MGLGFGVLGFIIYRVDSFGLRVESWGFIGFGVEFLSDIVCSRGSDLRGRGRRGIRGRRGRK